MNLENTSYILIDQARKIMKIRLSCSFLKRGKWHFGKCAELDLIDQGHSQREAFDHLVDMIIVTLVESVHLAAAFKTIEYTLKNDRVH